LHAPPTPNPNPSRSYSNHTRAALNQAAGQCRHSANTGRKVATPSRILPPCRQHTVAQIGLKTHNVEARIVSQYPLAIIHVLKSSLLASAKAAQSISYAKRKFVLLCTIVIAWSSCTPVASAEDFTGKVVGVADGDTLTVMHLERGEDSTASTHLREANPSPTEPSSQRAGQVSTHNCPT
jgi:hypothetical protein